MFQFQLYVNENSNRGDFILWIVSFAFALVEWSYLNVQTAEQKKKKKLRDNETRAKLRYLFEQSRTIPYESIRINFALPIRAINGMKISR